MSAHTGLYKIAIMASDPSPTIQQATAIPFRRQGGELEFCLITSAQKKHWAFPKGIIDPGESPAQTALKEAFEEAGLIGSIVSGPLGSYDYVKWDRHLTVTALLMMVSETAEEWQERDLRQRRWAAPQEALQLLAREELRQLLRVALLQLADSEAA